MVLEVEEDSRVARVKPSTSKREPTTLHSKDNLIMTTEEEELLREVEEEEVEVEELPIDAIDATSWDIGHLSVHTMKRQDTIYARQGKRYKPSDHGECTRDRRSVGNVEGVVEASQRSE